MRNLIRLVLVGACVAGTVAATAAGAGAGAILRVNRVTVVKVVDGPVAPGTTFTVHITCDNALSGGVGASALVDQDITFGSDGQPTSPDTVAVGAGVACTTTETLNGGATSTTYACEIARDQSDQGTLASCGVDAKTVEFGDVLGDTATITVTNHFPAAPPIQPVTPAAQAVQAAPAFTG